MASCRRISSLRQGLFVGHLDPDVVLKLVYMLSRQDASGDLKHEHDYIQCDETVIRGIRAKNADRRGRKRKIS